MLDAPSKKSQLLQREWTAVRPLIRTLPLESAWLYGLQFAYRLTRKDYWQGELYFKPPARYIYRSDLSAVKDYSLFGNGQAQPHPSSLAFAGIVETVKRSE